MDTGGIPELLERTPRGRVIALLLFVFFAFGLFSASRESATFDETAHLPAGFTYLDQRDFRHNPEHPPLAKAWAALPLWIGGLADVDYTSPHWVGTRASPSDVERSGANQWMFGFEFLNGPLGQRARKNPMRLLVPARAAMLMLGVLLGVVVYDWAARMWGVSGGLIALFLYSVSPTMLAHARLVTTDLPAAFGFTATLYAFWRFLREPGWPGAAVTGVALGIAFLTKFSTLLLVPLLPLVAIGWIARPSFPAGPPLVRIVRVASGLAIAAAIAWGAVWAGYGFRYTAASDPEYRLEWESVSFGEGAAAEVLTVAKDRRALPEAFLFGIAAARGAAEKRLAFLNGEQSVTGWWYYFPEAFALKTTPALLLLVAWVAGAAFARVRRRAFDLWYLGIPVLVYFGISMAGNLNLGHRHLAPVYPLLFVGAGGVVRLMAGRLRVGLGVGLLALQLVSFGFATPGYLSYFNVLAGGSRNGWRYLVDSNIDWGQDLPRLRDWMRDNGVPRVHLAYFGTADPRAYGVDYRKFLIAFDFYPEEPGIRPSSGDVFACSVTMLQGLYWDRDYEFAQVTGEKGWVGPEAVSEWLSMRNEHIEREKRYPSLAQWLVDRGHLTPERRREAESVTIATWLEHVRDDLTPVGYAGDSIRIYRIP